MRWKQFFTPAKSMTAPEAKQFMDGLSTDQYNLVDVRQPGEYESGHLPGAKLIPVGNLSERLAELDPAKPTLVY